MEPPDDEVRGSPNTGYSLSQARENFQNHSHMYDDGKAGTYLTNGSEGRKRLLEYIAAVSSGTAQHDQATLDRLIAEEREYWPWRHQKHDHQNEEAMLRILMA